MNNLQSLELDSEVVPNEVFKITDIESLNWAFRKLSAYQSKINEIQNLAKRERERIDRWERDELKSINDSVEYFEHLVQQYHSSILAEDPKAKTLSTPYGKSKTKTSQAQPEKVEGKEKELLDHILSNDMEDFIKKEVKWGDFKKSLSVAEIDGKSVAVDENGQVVPGVSIKAESTSYSVEVVKV